MFLVAYLVKPAYNGSWHQAITNLNWINYSGNNKGGEDSFIDFSQLLIPEILFQLFVHIKLDMYPRIDQKSKKKKHSFTVIFMLNINMLKTNDVDLNTQHS